MRRISAPAEATGIDGHLINEGNIAVEETAILAIAGIYEAAGGFLASPGFVENSEVRVTASPITPSTLSIRGMCSLTTNNLSNMTLSVEGFVAVGATLDVSGVTNHGTIQLTSKAGTVSSELAIPVSEFTNAHDGRLEVLPGEFGGGRSISGSFVNLGTFDTEVISTLLTGTMTNVGRNLHFTASNACHRWRPLGGGIVDHWRRNQRN